MGGAQEEGDPRDGQTGLDRRIPGEVSGQVRQKQGTQKVCWEGSKQPPNWSRYSEGSHRKALRKAGPGRIRTLTSTPECEFGRTGHLQDLQAEQRWGEGIQAGERSATGRCSDARPDVKAKGRAWGARE